MGLQPQETFVPVRTAAALTCSPGALSWAGLRWLSQGQAQPALMEERTTGPDTGASDSHRAAVPRRECVKAHSGDASRIN